MGMVLFKRLVSPSQFTYVWYFTGLNGIIVEQCLQEEQSLMLLLQEYTLEIFHPYLLLKLLLIVPFGKHLGLVATQHHHRLPMFVAVMQIAQTPILMNASLVLVLIVSV